MQSVKQEPYRPTVRCSRKYERYINQLQKETKLDRNQIIRLALFVAPYSGAFRSIVEKNMKTGFIDCPMPPWSPLENILWQTQDGE